MSSNESNETDTILEVVRRDIADEFQKRDQMSAHRNAENKQRLGWVSLVFVPALITAAGLTVFVFLTEYPQSVSSTGTSVAIPSVEEIAAELARNHADELRGPSGPAIDGIVIASTVMCGDLPGGWRSFTQASGRFIVGNDGRSDWHAVLDDGELVFATGGEEQVALSIPEMPSHDHDAETRGDSAEVFVHVSGHADGVQLLRNNGTGIGLHYDHTHDIPTEGGSQPHNNMPPYIALHWCTPGAA